ncbi:aminotransferase class V-fold PLP-dependent enzyme [Neomegalonema sp.]|uniref:aminotransferase class V-fold PLP-dependent enzyme n=1 Tax=Neomegalonema sp. TaxID=2039713 RepID=UPI0026285F98|nr:aminotransferase class V-fold PLP-dependent enzyme [Neomegalonema sp.]MDD2869207.1 aminotransferase class V-fold PLP-dependent enzyme [Neomegalonema sp.]
MRPVVWSTPPDPPPFPASGYADLAESFARILNTTNDLLLIQGEAMVALEAAAASLGAPGRRALNLVTSLYGRWFGAWLRRAGVEVVDLLAEPGKPLAAELVEEALKRGRFDILVVVHAESASGILNPLEAVAALAKAHGALLVVDAVASVGGHELDLTALGADLVAVGPQKALGGQAGVSALAVSPAAWAKIAPSGEAPSILSLADQRALWLEQGRGALPGTPSALEFHALAGSLARVEAEGLAALRDRHRRAASAARAGVLALTGRAWVPPAQASNLVTAAALPEGISVAALLAVAPPEHALTAGVGPGAERLIRLNHTGPRARLETVLEDLAALAHGLRALGLPADAGAALAAAREASS